MPPGGGEGGGVRGGGVVAVWQPPGRVEITEMPAYDYDIISKLSA